MKTQIKRIAFSFLLIIAPLFVHAQDGLLLKANELYTNLAYSQAIPKYEKALKGEILKGEKFKIEALVKLADCYRLTNNNSKALETFNRIIALNFDLDTTHRFYYAQSLMIAGKYEYAKSYLNSFKPEDEAKSNANSKIFAKSITEIKQFYKNASNYRIKKVSFNSSKNDFAPSFWNDKIVFTSSRDAAYLTNHKNDWTGDNYDALYYSKQKKNGKFDKVRKFKNIKQSKYNDGSTSFSEDGKYVYFTRNNVINNNVIKGIDGRINLKIFYAQDTNNKFENPKELLFNSNDYNCAHPSINPERNILYFSSDMPGGFGGMDIWACYIINGFYSKPVNLGDKINTKGNEVFPYIFDKKTLYFSSNGLDGMGGLDIFKTYLNEEGKPVGIAENMGSPINSTFDDFGIVLYPGADSGYYCSNYGNPKNDDDIYAFRIIDPILQSIDIKGMVTEKHSNQAIPGSKVSLKSANGTLIEEILTDENGKFTFNTAIGKDYLLECRKDGYVDAIPKAISTKGQEGNSEITSNLILEKKTNIRLIISVVNVKDQKPLDNVRIDLINNFTNLNDSFYTASDGIYSLPLAGKKSGDSLNFRFTLSKEGFISKVIDWEYYIKKPQDITLNTSIGKIEVGNSLQNLITLKPIYFDFNKYNIRPDAALELDKIVSIMNQFPNFSIDLSSHTDCRGDAKTNQILSEKRAESSVNYIVSKGILKNRLTPKGFGESRLVNQCECEGKRVVPCTEEEHAMNRRTEFLIVRITEITQNTTSAMVEQTKQINLSKTENINSKDSKFIEHIVEKGESLFGIAKKYGCSPEKIREINNFPIDYSLQAGKTIKIPTK